MKTVKTVKHETATNKAASKIIWLCRIYIILRKYTSIATFSDVQEET